MKKVFAALLCLSMLALVACGQNPKGVNDGLTTSKMESTTEEVLPPDDGIFDYQKSDLPEGWVVDETYCTSTYLQATYGEGEDAPMLTVSVYEYDDADGAAKAKSLAEAVHSREIETASEISETKIGGTNFYILSFASRTTEGKLRYEAYGQSQPDKNQKFHFVLISFENVENAKQFETLKPVLNSIEFGF